MKHPHLVLANLVLSICGTFAGLTQTGTLPTILFWLGGVAFGVATTVAIMPRR